MAASPTPRGEMQGCSDETAPEKVWSGTTALAPGMAEAWFMGGSSHNREPAALTALTCDDRVLLLVRFGPIPSVPCAHSSWPLQLPLLPRSLAPPVLCICDNRFIRLQLHACGMLHT